MRLKRLSAAVAISALPGLAIAQSTAWQTYVVAETGAKIDVPVTVFSRDAGKPDAGYGFDLIGDLFDNGRVAAFAEVWYTLDYLVHMGKRGY